MQVHLSLRAGPCPEGWTLSPSPLPDSGAGPLTFSPLPQSPQATYPQHLPTWIKPISWVSGWAQQRTLQVTDRPFHPAPHTHTHTSLFAYLPWHFRTRTGTHRPVGVGQEGFQDFQTEFQLFFYLILHFKQITTFSSSLCCKFSWLAQAPIFLGTGCQE